MNFVRSAARVSLPLAILFALLATVGPRPALAAGVVGNGTPGSCTETAFNNALGGGGNVTFNCGASPVTITLTFYKQIDDDTNINGKNLITLSAANGYHFQVHVGKSLILKNIRLTNGNSSVTGAVENFGTTKTVNVTFLNNKSTGEGGAIVNHGTLKVKNSLFKKNTSADGGGAIWNDGGNAKIKDSILKKNSATNHLADGGAISNNVGDVIVDGSTLKKNSADEGGGFYGHFDSTNTIKRSTFLKNEGHNGAGLENFGGMGILSSTFSKNLGTGMGGGIYQGGSMSISKTTIKGNHGDRGAGIFISAASTAIFQTTISGNVALHGGGGVFSESEALIENSTLSGNTAGGGQGGGGWDQDDDEATFQFVTVANNTAPFGAGINANAVSNPGGKITLQNTALSSNTGGNCAGGANIISSGYNLSSDTNCGTFTQTGDKNNTPANLGALTNNGGPTETHLPQAGSQLINNGLNDAQIHLDQRGFPRPVGPKSDIGSVEVQ